MVGNVELPCASVSGSSVIMNNSILLSPSTKAIKSPLVNASTLPLIGIFHVPVVTAADVVVIGPADCIVCGSHTYEVTTVESP